MTTEIILAPSPKAHSTLALLLRFVHEELHRIGAPRDLVLQLPAPVTREQTYELMRQVDLVVATGSQTNVRAAGRWIRRTATAQRPYPTSPRGSRPGTSSIAHAPCRRSTQRPMR